MLIDFTISNFRSIKEAVTLSMLATKIKEHPNNIFQPNKEKNINLIRSTVIYGANASGKSNILRAFDVFQDFVVLSTDLKVGEKIKYYQPFKLEKTWPKKPAMFEIEFVGKDSVRYRYMVEFDSDEIIKESLVFFPKGQEANLFLREKDKPIKFGDYFHGPARSIENQLIKNNLFLSKAANSNNKLMEDIYLYFRNTLRLSTYDMPGIMPMNFTTKECLDHESPIDTKIIGELLKIADTGIDYFDIHQRMDFDDMPPFPEKFPDELKKEILEQFKYQPRMFHKIFDNESEAGEIGFDIGEESDGTVKLYDLAGRILHVLINGKVFIIDELNNSLHPIMTELLVEIFNNPESNPNNAQLIFATHDTTLLNPDLFRRDQIWLTEKDQFGATSLYSLGEFDYRKVRGNTPFDKWYLSGRFGALPIIGDFKNWIKNAQKKASQ